MPRLKALVRRLRGRARPLVLLVVDAVSVAFSLALSCRLTLGGSFPAGFAPLLLALWAVRLPLLVMCGLHAFVYRASRRGEALRILLATVLGTLGFAALVVALGLASPLPSERLVGLLAVEGTQTLFLLLASRWALREAVARLRDHDRPYDKWLRKTEAGAAGRAAGRLAALATRPLVSVLVPVYRTHGPFLDRAIASVRAQSYPHWELVLVDDGSRSPAIDARLARAAQEDPRIRVDQLPENRGISAASNRALALARGEFVALLDHDDELATDALLHLVSAFDANPQADLVYSDEDHIDEAGRRHDPFFKPDWSPDLVLAENYVCHLMAVRRSLVEEVGGFRSETDGSQDHDLLLRASQRARAIVHVPRILYHWRTAVEPVLQPRVSFDGGRIFASSRRAVEDHLRDTQPGARVEEGRWPGRWRIRYPVPPALEVAILVSGASPPESLLRCLESLVGLTAYPHYHLAVSVPGGSAAALAEWSARHGRSVLALADDLDGPAARNALARAAVAAAQPALLLFLDAEAEVLTPDWLTSMVELAARPEVGVVGAKLVDAADRIQHAGIVLGIRGGAGHAFRGCPDGDRLYYDFPDLVRNVSAVTGACLLVRSATFLELGGFDETSPAPDVELCLRARQKDLRVLYDPYAVVRHHRPDVLGPGGLRLAGEGRLAPDPFYNPNLARDREDYALGDA